MYTTCPKCKFERQDSDNSDPDICPGCGIIFSKWMKQKFSSPEKQKINSSQIVINKQGHLISGLSTLLYVEDKVNPFIFYGRVVVFIGIVILGWQFINMDFVTNPAEIGNAFLHRVNLIFHEAGHILFMPFGWFMTKLGGTLGQLLMPIVVMLVFLIKQKNTFGAAVGLWWLGQNFIDCAPYIDDAMDQQLVLLGGFTGADKPGSHDWNNILTEFDIVNKHREVATTFDTIGIILIIMAILWSGFLIFKQYKKLDSF